jgi:archaellin
LASYEDLSATVDLSSIDSISLWVRSTVDTAAGDIEIVVDNTAACGSPLENIDIPALVANTWNLVTLPISDNDDMTAIKCVGLYVVTDNGNQSVNLDEVVAQSQATSILVTITNTLEGEPIDVSEPSDSDADGNSDSDSGHTMILTYTDKNQVVRDVYWTKTFIGNNDGDDLLEAGEKVEIDVRLGALSNTYPVIGDVKWDIEVRPEDGGTVVIQRIMPDIIDTVMNLN